MPPRGFVERFGCHVEAAGPRDRAELLLHVDLRERDGIPERLEHTEPLPIIEGDVADGSVLEREPQRVAADHLDARHVNKCRYLGHTRRLRERLDFLERLVVSSALPVGEQFGSVQLSPLQDESKLRARQGPS